MALASGRRVQTAAAVLVGAGACLCTLLFASGFLLSRTELPNRSACRDPDFATRPAGPGSCWLPRRFDRLVLLLVDALRFDFLQPNSSQLLHFWANNVLAIDELQRTRPRHVFVAHVEADAPTTTLQRLKALLTGTLPTFIDASANFGGAELAEDNLIDQLVARNRSVVFMGDDTWVGMLPGRFLRAYPFPSFNVHDLDTVDRGVERHLAEELKRPDWDLLIAHVLGVDHCGHRYGPDHPEMRRKLREVDALIRTLIQGMDERTLLAVVGDHGMTTSGDHGGGSPDESDAGLALVSNSRPLLTQEEALEALQQPPRLAQIDLVPTLALLLGVPVPFSSLGAAPPALFDPERTAAQAVNARQVLRFLDTYQAAYADLPAARLDALRAAAAGAETAEDWQRVLADAKAACRDVWTRFDEPAIRLALFAFATCLAFGGAFAIRDSEEAGGGSRLLAGLAAAMAACVAAHLGRDALPAAIVWGIPSVALACGVACVCARLWAMWTAVDASPPDLSSRLSHATCAASAMACGFASLCHLSNSFIIFEPACLHYLLQTLLLLQAAATAAAILQRARTEGLRRKPCKSLATHPFTLTLAVHAAAALCLRLGLGLVTCREEARTAGCRDTWMSAAAASSQDGGSGQSQQRLAAALLLLVACLFAFRWWLSSCGSLLNDSSPAVLTLSYVPGLVALCAQLHWVLQASTINASASILPRVGLALTGAGFLILLVKPVTVFILHPSKDREKALASALARGGRSLAEIASAIYREKLRPSAQDERLGYGLTCVYRTAHCGLVLLAALAALLLAGHRAVPALALCAGAALGRAELRSTQLRLGRGRPLESLADLPDLLQLQLLGWFAFYAMGHQPALSAIRWDPAFIFYSAETSGAGGRAVAAALVAAAMFCAQALASLAAPLLLLLLPLTCGRLPFALRPKWRRALGVEVEEDAGDYRLAVLPRGSLSWAAAGALARLLLLGLCLALGCMAAAAWHRRHLMAWKVFAPRMMFGVVGCAASAVGAGATLLCFTCVDWGVRRWATRTLGLQESED